MPKAVSGRVYTKAERDVALSYLEVYRGDVKRAAKKARVEVQALQLWAKGGDENALDLDAPALDLTGRPFPPAALLERWPGLFTPAPEVLTWIEQNFLAGDGPLFNPHHSHLCFAQIGVLWTNVPNGRQGKTYAGMAEIVAPKGGPWVAERELFLLKDWFGYVPDFIITLDAPFMADADDWAFGAVVDHELYHCGQKKDRYGIPKWSEETGKPVWELRIHEVEEFVGVVERWGVGAAAANVAELVAAAGRKPTLAPAKVELACGCCKSRF